MAHFTDIKLTGQALLDAIAEAKAYLATRAAEEAQARREASQRSK